MASAKRLRMHYLRAMIDAQMDAREIACVLPFSESMVRYIARQNGWTFTRKASRPHFRRFEARALKVYAEDGAEEAFAYALGLAGALAGSMTYHEQLNDCGLKPMPRAFAEFLLERPGWIKTYSQISAAMWGDEDQGASRKHRLYRYRMSVERRAGHLVDVTLHRGVGYSARFKEVPARGFTVRQLP